VCVECGYEGNADVVAAINIRDRGLSIVKYEGQDFARIACEVNGAAMPPAAGTHRSDSDLASCHA
jgi:putative transposase